MVEGADVAAAEAAGISNLVAKMDGHLVSGTDHPPRDRKQPPTTQPLDANYRRVFFADAVGERVEFASSLSMSPTVDTGYGSIRISGASMYPSAPVQRT
jgi:hypothetical protein